MIGLLNYYLETRGVIEKCLKDRHFRLYIFLRYTYSGSSHQNRQQNDNESRSSNETVNGGEDFVIGVFDSEVNYVPDARYSPERSTPSGRFKAETIQASHMVTKYI